MIRHVTGHLPQRNWAARFTDTSGEHPPSISNRLRVSSAADRSRPFVAVHGLNTVSRKLTFAFEEG